MVNLDDLDFGVDVSHWNAVADANAVRGAGITFAWVKATEGTDYVDPTFAAKVAQLRAAGIVVGAYGFAHGNVDLRAQAEHFRDTARKEGCLDIGALAPMFDGEANDLRGNANDALCVWYDVVGVAPQDAYGNLDWWRNVYQRSAWATRDLLGHIARYNGDPGNPGWSGDKLAAHQHTNAGDVAGIPGKVDRNCTMPGYRLPQLCIGGVAEPGPAPAPAPSGGGAAPAAGDTWTVRAGDTLSRIASAWHVTVSALAAANNIANPDLIYPGQVIHRPGSGGAAPAPAAGGSRYTVAAGDTLSGIAARFGTTVAALVAVNHISNPDRIYVGQVLTLPAGAPPAPSDRVYTVRRGDTLGAIANRLGYPGGYRALAQRNGIPDPNRIYPGQIIHY